VIMPDSTPQPLEVDQSILGQASSSGKWLVAAAVLLGTFLSVIDVTVVNVAMPHMMGAFGSTCSP
jgi:hypothetical protein